MKMIYSDYNYIVYYGLANNGSEKFLYERPILKSSKLANEFLAMQYADFIDESDKVKLSLFENTEMDNDLVAELAEVSCMQFSENDKSLSADYYTMVDQSKIIALNVETNVVSIVLETRDKNNEVITKSKKILFKDFNNVNKLVFIINSYKKISNLSPIIHEYSNIPHNGILDKIVTLKSLSEALQMIAIDGTFNNQAGISLGDELVDYETKITPSWSVYEDKLLINGVEVHG